MTATPEEILMREKERLADNIKIGPNVWAAYSLAELAPRPCAYSAALVGEISSCYGGWGRAISELGFSYSWKLGNRGFFREICGRLYIDLNREAMTYYGSMPLEHDYSEILKNPSSAFYHRPGRPARTGFAATFLSPFHAWRLLRSDSTMRKRRVQNMLQYELVLKNLSEEADASLENARLKKGEEETLEAVHSTTAFITGGLSKAYIFSSTLANMSQMSLEAAMAINAGAEGLALSRILTCALDGDPSVRFTLGLCDVADGKIGEKELLNKFGYHSMEPLDAKSPRLFESADALDALISCVRKTGAAAVRGAFEENRQAQVKANVEIRKRLLDAMGSRDIEKFFVELDSARAYAAYERAALEILIKSCAALRLSLMRLGELWKIGADIFYLKPEEISRRPENLRQIASDRRAEHEAALSLPMPTVVFSSEPQQLGKILDYSAETAVKVVGLSAGKGTGPVKTIRKHGDFGKNFSGSVAVMESANPICGPVFAAAPAVVVGSASPTGSATALGRAFGVPVAACVANVFDRFSDGEEIEADGMTGEIRFPRRARNESGEKA